MDFTWDGIINFEYKHITPHKPDIFYQRDELSPEELKDPTLRRRVDELISTSAIEFKQLVENTEISSIESNYSTGHLIYDEDVSKNLVHNLDSCLMNYISSSEFYKHIRTDKANIVIGDFKTSESAAGISKATQGRTYILISEESYSNEKNYASVIAHEIGHKLGLPHTINPYDIMSYAPFAQTFGHHTGKLGFSIESREIWNKIKNHFN